MNKTNKMIAVVFGSEADAMKGLSALKELHTQGVITLYSSAIAVKDNLDIITMPMTRQRKRSIQRSKRQRRNSKSFKNAPIQNWQMQKESIREKWSL